MLGLYIFLVFILFVVGFCVVVLLVGVGVEFGWGWMGSMGGSMLVNIWLIVFYMLNISFSFDGSSSR